MYSPIVGASSTLAARYASESPTSSGAEVQLGEDPTKNLGPLGTWRAVNRYFFDVDE